MQNDAPPEGEVFVVGSMTQLAHYVYQDYQMRIDSLRTEALQKQKVIFNTQIIIQYKSSKVRWFSGS